jgi:nicotinamidase-related amidase
MTTLSGRSNTAVLVIDAQIGVMSGVYNRDAVVANISLLINKARAEDVAVVWVQHSGDDMSIDSDGWQFIPELSRRAAEPVVPKRYPDSFEESDLEPVLAERHVGRLIVSGAQTDECIRATLHGAIVRGYDATLISDAHSTEDLTPWGAPPPDKVIDHTNLYWQNHLAPGRQAGTVQTGSVVFSGP